MPRSKVSENFEKLLDQYLVVPLSRYTDNIIMASIRNSFVLCLPLLFAGSIAQLVINFPLPIYQSILLKNLGPGWKSIGLYIYSGTISMISIVVAVSFGYNLAINWNKVGKGRKVDPLVCALVSLGSVLVMMQPTIIYAERWMGINGLFVTIVISVVSSLIFIKLYNIRKFYLKVFARDVDYILPKVMTSILPAFITFIIVAVVRALFIFITRGDVYTVVNSLLTQDYSHAITSNSVVALIFYVIFVQLFWFLGIHGGNVMVEASQGQYSVSLLENVHAFSINEPVTNIVTKSFLDVFVFMGGAGSTICLLIAIALVANTGGVKKIGQISLVPTLFNINELMLFGLPIIFNPFFLIPFVLCPLVMAISSFTLTYFGALPYTISEVEWTMPPLLNAYYATGSLKGVVIQIFNIIVGTLIYIPFITAHERSKTKGHKQAYVDMVDLISSGALNISERKDIVGAVCRGLIIDFENAFKDQELFLEYQPRVDYKDNKIYAVNSQLRWRHEAYGIIPSKVIVNIAEESDMVDELGFWVLEESAKRLAVWEGLAVLGKDMIVNVSIRQLSNLIFAEEAERVVLQHLPSVDRFVLEVTNSSMLVNSAMHEYMLFKIRDAGFRISLDDFAVGYNSLMFMRENAINMIKTDTRFAKEIYQDSEGSKKVVMLLNEMFEKVGFQIVVGHVNTNEQLELLTSMGLRYFQGDVFCKPLPAEGILFYIQKCGHDGILVR